MKKILWDGCEVLNSATALLLIVHCATILFSLQYFISFFPKAFCGWIALLGLVCQTLKT